jgi:hypothetical protein
MGAIRGGTEADALLRLRELPGFSADEDGWGHKLMSPQGMIWFRGIRANDEVFASDKFGLLNISEIDRNVGDAEGRCFRIPIDVPLLRNIARIEVDHAYVRDMPIERRNKPIYLIFGSDGLNVIDGSHRIFRRVADGMTDIKAHFLVPDVLSYIRVTKRLMRAGEWIPDDLVSDDAFAHELDGARRAFQAFELENGLT